MGFIVFVQWIVNYLDSDVISMRYNYPLDNSIGFGSTYPMDIDLSSG